MVIKQFPSVIGLVTTESKIDIAMYSKTRKSNEIKTKWSPLHVLICSLSPIFNYSYVALSLSFARGILCALYKVDSDFNIKII